MHFATISSRRGALLGVLLAAQAPAQAQAQAQAPAPQSVADSALLTHIAAMARQKTTQLQAGQPAPAAPVLALYREALADMDRGELSVAATELTAALARAPQNALFRGDLAYVYAKGNALDNAASEYTRAYQAMQRNPWYLVGLATVRAAQRQWADAAGTMQTAVTADSVVVDSLTAGAASLWYEAAGDHTAALAWARLAVQKAPNDAQSWLRIALTLRQRQDTTPEGEAAIRHYIAIRGAQADQVANALLADHLYNRGKVDSALAMVATAAQDTGYREYAAQLFLQAGREQFQHRNADSAIALLARGRTWATPAQLPPFANITGRAQILKLQALLNDLQETHSCEGAYRADSLATTIDQNLRQGQSFDSARTAMMITAVLPGFKQSAQTAITSCRPAGQTAPARRPPPARRPARP